MARTVSDVLVQALSDSGVDTVFGLHGNGINGLIEALRTAREKIATSTSATKRPRR